MIELVGVDNIKEICPCIDIEIEMEKKDESFHKMICTHKAVENQKEVLQIKKNVRGYFKSNDKKDSEKRLWGFWGKVEDNKWVCLEVGSSTNICKEICEIIGLMGSEQNETGKTGYFHDDVKVYKFMCYSDKNSRKYRRVNELFNDFMWVEIVIDKYLKNIEIGEFNRVNYAEVKYAKDYAALIWNPAPAMGNNQEKEILKKFENDAKKEK